MAYQFKELSTGGGSVNISKLVEGTTYYYWGSKGTVYFNTTLTKEDVYTLFLAAKEKLADDYYGGYSNYQIDPVYYYAYCEYFINATSGSTWGDLDDGIDIVMTYDYSSKTVTIQKRVNRYNYNADNGTDVTIFDGTNWLVDQVEFNRYGADTTIMNDSSYNYEECKGVGCANDLLTNLVSSTPFFETVKIEGELDGSNVEVTANSTVDIKALISEGKLPMEINVNVPIPDGYIQPEGTLEITENGDYDVTEKTGVTVNVASSGGGSGEDMLQARIDATNSCQYLFYYYTGYNVDYIANLDTSKVTNMQGMFQSCSKLTSVPQLDTSKVTNMNGMFSDCRPLTSVPQLDTSNVTSMSSMFSNCRALETIDITYYNISAIYNTNYFLNNCLALKSLIIRGFGKYFISTDTFANSGIAKGTGYIYVPRTMVDTLKSATNWSTYADQIRALEDYTVDGTTTGALDSTKI